MSGKEDCNILGPTSCGSNFFTVSDCTQRLVRVRVCETASSE